jgi:hypothetical protein
MWACPGPAMSLRTENSSLPQKEQLRSDFPMRIFQKFFFSQKKRKGISFNEK